MSRGKFLKSAVLPADYPEGDRPEIAMVGRSNAGKSSLLNALCGGDSKIAKVSSTPGKTRLLNFFDVGDRYRLVDLPGYGYAARNFEEKFMWGKMIQDFFDIRTNLIGLILICDVRREWTEEETMLLDLALAQDLNFCCVLTKIDKLGKSELEKHIKTWVTSSGQDRELFRPVSNLKGNGVIELEKSLFKDWIAPLTKEA